jgi:hypothetical protein
VSVVNPSYFKLIEAEFGTMPIEALADSVSEHIARRKRKGRHRRKSKELHSYGNELNKNPGAWPGFQIIVGPD